MKKTRVQKSHASVPLTNAYLFWMGSWLVFKYPAACNCQAEGMPIEAISFWMRSWLACKSPAACNSQAELKPFLFGCDHGWNSQGTYMYLRSHLILDGIIKFEELHEN